CQPRIVRGVTRNKLQRWRGTRPARRATSARWDQVKRGRGTWRRSTASWWRSTRISASFAALSDQWTRRPSMTRRSRPKRKDKAMGVEPRRARHGWSNPVERFTDPSGSDPISEMGAPLTQSHQAISERRLSDNTISRSLWTADGIALETRCWVSDDIVRGAVVIAHGFTACKDNPRVVRLASELYARGFDVIAYDARGHGHSGGSCTLGALHGARCSPDPRHHVWHKGGAERSCPLIRRGSHREERSLVRTGGLGRGRSPPRYLSLNRVKRTQLSHP